MSKFSDATYAWMKRAKIKQISSQDLWAALQKSNPELTTVSETRKTPRTTLMRDLRKDQRFVVGDRRVSLAE